MDSNVIGWDGEIEGDIISFDDDDVGDDDDDGVSGIRSRRAARGRGRGASGTKRVIQLSDAQLAQLAAKRGMRLVSGNPRAASQYGLTVGDGIIPTMQRRQPAPFDNSNARAKAAGTAFKLVANVQKGFQMSRLFARAFFSSSGVDAAQFVNLEVIKVGTENQLVSDGTVLLEMFSPYAVRADVTFDPARTGNEVVLAGFIDPLAPNPVTIQASCIGTSARR